MRAVPGWIIPAFFCAGFIGILCAIATRNTRREIERTLARRANPTKEEFLAMMASDTSPDAAEFLWETSRIYLEPRLTPHPDDDLARDLPIDDDDWSMDWPRDFAKRQGFHESNLPPWPKDWPATIRNYGRWLSMGPLG